jgi:hypothetical protein
MGKKANYRPLKMGIKCPMFFSFSMHLVNKTSKFVNQEQFLPKFFKLNWSSGCAVRFRLMRNKVKNKPKFFFASKRKKPGFSHVSLRSEKLEIRSETKPN